MLRGIEPQDAAGYTIVDPSRTDVNSRESIEQRPMDFSEYVQ